MSSSQAEKVLVTGAAGFMGSHLVDLLVVLGYEVYGVDDLSGGYKENINKKSYFTQLDLRSKGETHAYISDVKPAYVFHLAADAAEGRSQFTPINSTERNYNSYLNILVPAIKSGFKKILLTSSMSVYGSQTPPFREDMPREPDDIYGIAKSAMEAATEVLSDVYGFSYTIIRPHNVYGPRQNLADPYRNVVGIFINRLLANKNFYIYGDGNQKRAFTYIEDFTPYCVKAMFDMKCNREIFNIGPLKEYTINELSKVVLREFFKEVKIPVHLMPEYLPLRPQEVKDAWCSVEKAEKVLGYKSTISLEEGVKRMIEWAKKVGYREFKYLDDLELISNNTPVTWTKKLI